MEVRRGKGFILRNPRKKNDCGEESQEVPCVVDGALRGLSACVSVERRMPKMQHQRSRTEIDRKGTVGLPA
jgi:hypothetical protein